MLSSGANVIIWDEMLSCGIQCYHLELMLSSGWDEMISSGPNVIMLQSGANVIIWCYHVMLSSGMITPPFFIFTENFTHSYSGDLVFSVHHEIHKYRRVLSKRARTYPPRVYQILALKSLCFLPRLRSLELTLSLRGVGHFGHTPL